VDNEHDLSGIGIDVGDHLLNHGADDALFQPRVGGWGGPDRAQIVCQRCERGQRRLTARRYRRIVLDDLRLNFGDLQQRPVPARLQFRRHQAIGGISRIILAECTVGGIPSGFEIPQQRLADFIAP